MEFHEGCIDIAKKSWELNVVYPVILGFKQGQLKMIEFDDGVSDEKDLIQFVHDISGDDWDALAIINQVWFDIITFGKPLKFALSDKNPDAQDGLAVALITRNRSYATLAKVENGELGDFTPWRIKVDPLSRPILKKFKLHC
jgi:hypothetical protein